MVTLASARILFRMERDQSSVLVRLAFLGTALWIRAGLTPIRLRMVALLIRFVTMARLTLRSCFVRESTVWAFNVYYLMFDSDIAFRDGWMSMRLV